MTRSIILALIASSCVWGTVAEAQFSFYSSLSYSFHQNPLYNYQKLPDQLKQAYLETGYVKQYAGSALRLQYVGGLMLFRNFQDRNFYEHSLLAGSKFLFGDIVRKPVSEADSANNDEADTSVRDSTKAIDKDEEDMVSQDSSQVQTIDSTRAETEYESEDSSEDTTRSFVDLALKIAARHDKLAYDEFDNDGIEFLTNYRSATAEQFFYRLTNNLSIRSYRNISELSNATDVLAFEMSNASQSKLRYGFVFSGGMKYYTESAYDTSRFERQRTFITKAPGKGKPGANLLTPSDKKILVTSQSNGTIQLVGELYLEKRWGQASLGASIIYRKNLRSSPRYLAQTTSASILKEDVYNDYFSYEGPELRGEVADTVFGGVSAKLGVSFSRKQYGAPALDLLAIEIGPHRIDNHASVDLYLSRDFTLWGEVTADVFIAAEMLRNLSNDQYNDFSASMLSVGIGIGF